MFKGIDVSTWQGDIDWEKVKNSGVDFTIIREGYGKKSPNQIDEKFKQNYEGAKSVGLPVGIYHYSYALNDQDAVSEAQFCLENITGLELDYPVCFDIEDSQLLALSNRQRTDVCSAFCQEIEKAGYYAMIYCNLNWINNYLYKEELLPRYDLWLAQWSSDNPSLTCGLWQKSDCGKIDGINGNVDLNISYKNYPEIIKSKGLNKISTDFFTYEVIKGDCLWSLAQKYLGSGLKYLKIKELNNLSTDTIYVGQTIKIPNK